MALWTIMESGLLRQDLGCIGNLSLGGSEASSKVLGCMETRFLFFVVHLGDSYFDIKQLKVIESMLP
eukprot:5935744-Amphidinium_carterae.2